MNTSPLMLTAKDDDLLGVSNRWDAMGVLVVWSVRGRDLVSHLTAKTTNVRGFQILVEAFRLWERSQSTDLEMAMKEQLEAAGFVHHLRLKHPRVAEGFEYDFWREKDGVAIEVMGYRADDEIYKDILKFHVHEGTRVGVVLVPRYKWISSKRTETNYAATRKAMAFADRYMAVDGLVVIAYDWREGGVPGLWRLVFPKEAGT